MWRIATLHYLKFDSNSSRFPSVFHCDSSHRSDTYRGWHSYIHFTSCFRPQGTHHNNHSCIVRVIISALLRQLCSFNLHNYALVIFKCWNLHHCSDLGRHLWLNTLHFQYHFAAFTYPVPLYHIFSEVFEKHWSPWLCWKHSTLARLLRHSPCL